MVRKPNFYFINLKENISEKLKIGDHLIEQVSDARYLGVVFDDKLNFEEQFKRIKSKIVNGFKALMCIRQTFVVQWFH